MIRKLGSDPEQLFPFHNFEEHLKKFAKLAFLMGPLMVMMMLADPKDIPDLDELSNDMGTKAEFDFIKSYNEEVQKEYVSRINDLLTDLVELDYYWN